MKYLSNTPFKIRKMNLMRFGRDFRPEETIILRDYLAIERTRLANERTLLSYIRYSMYLLLGGIAFFQLTEFSNFQFLGILSLLFSSIFFVIGIYRFTLLKKSLKKLYDIPEPGKGNKLS